MNGAAIGEPGTRPVPRGPLATSPGAREIARCPRDERAAKRAGGRAERPGPCVRGRGRAPVSLGLILALLPSGVEARPIPTTLIVPPEKHTLGIHRVTNVHLKMFTGVRNRFRRPEGIACAKLIAQDDPKTTADDDELTAYGVNSGDPSIIYNDSMTSVKTWRGEMRQPRGVAADATGRVVVADTGNHRVLFLRNVGGKLALERTVGKRGAGPGELDGPTGVALDSRGRVYVTDTANHRVQVFDPLGERLWSFGARGTAPGQLVSPTGIAVVDRDEPWSYRKRDLAFVIDRGGRRIQSFAQEGRLVSAFEDTTRGGMSFAWLALDYHNNVYVTDPRACRIHKFDENLRHIVSFGERGTGDAQFLAPTGIAIWRRYGQVFVAESTGAQYYWVGTDVLGLAARPAEFPSGSAQQIQYALTEPSEVTVAALDERGAVAREIVSGRRQEAGAVRVAWNGRGAAGAPLAPGRYRIRVDALPTYSSRKHFHREVTTLIKILSAPAGGADGGAESP